MGTFSPESPTIFDGKNHGFPVDFPNKTNPMMVLAEVPQLHPGAGGPRAAPGGGGAATGGMAAVKNGTYPLVMTDVAMGKSTHFQ